MNSKEAEAVTVRLAALPARVRTRAQSIAEDCLMRRDGYRQYRGKRLRYDRRRISVPVGQRYRLLFLDGPDGLTLVGAMSHEQYTKEIKKR